MSPDDYFRKKKKWCVLGEKNAYIAREDTKLTTLVIFAI